MPSTGFTNGLRACVRALWIGAWDLPHWTEAMVGTIRSYYTWAWEEGTREAGLDPADMSPDEMMALERVIFDALVHLTTFGEAIVLHSKAAGGKLGPLFSRVEVWANGYDHVRQEAFTLVSKDTPLTWVLGHAEHCSSCSKLAGKTKRASYWRQAGVQPRVPNAWFLACRGYNCQCELQALGHTLSRGRLPSLP